MPPLSGSRATGGAAAVEAAAFSGARREAGDGRPGDRGWRRRNQRRTRAPAPTSSGERQRPDERQARWLGRRCRRQKTSLHVRRLDVLTRDTGFFRSTQSRQVRQVRDAVRAGPGGPAGSRGSKGSPRPRGPAASAAPISIGASASATFWRTASTSASTSRARAASGARSVSSAGSAFVERQPGLGEPGRGCRVPPDHAADLRGLALERCRRARRENSDRGPEPIRHVVGERARKHVVQRGQVAAVRLGNALDRLRAGAGQSPPPHELVGDGREAEDVGAAIPRAAADALGRGVGPADRRRHADAFERSRDAQADEAKIVRREQHVARMQRPVDDLSVGGVVERLRQPARPRAARRPRGGAPLSRITTSSDSAVT